MYTPRTQCNNSNDNWVCKTKKRKKNGSDSIESPMAYCFEKISEKRKKKSSVMDKTGDVAKRNDKKKKKLI